MTGRKPKSEPVQPFTDEDLTERFVSAIPEITRELNLELATATYHETFTRQSELKTLWGLIDLGTSIVLIQVPSPTATTCGCGIVGSWNSDGDA